MDRLCHCELAFRVLTDSRVQCAPAIGVLWQMDRKVFKETGSISSRAMKSDSSLGIGLFICHQFQSSTFILQ